MTVPKSLSDPHASVAAERENAKLHYADAARAASYDFKQYREHHDIHLALAELFDGKCAYCEGPVGAVGAKQIEHYRPKASVSDDDTHTGYWWLASDWSNLLLSCIPCNQKRRQHLITPDMTESDYLALISTRPRDSYGKLDQFPVGGTRSYKAGDDLALEDPHLIDPTERDPATELRWAKTCHFSIVLPAEHGGTASPYGLATIHICALNRAELVSARTALLNVLRVQRDRILSSLQADDSAAGIAYALERVKDMELHAGKDQPFSAMVKAFVAELATEVGALRQT